jgi:hypothetical protein
MNKAWYTSAKKAERLKHQDDFEKALKKMDRDGQ